MVISDNEIDSMKFNYNLWIKLNGSVCRQGLSNAAFKQSKMVDRKRRTNQKQLT